MQPLPKSDIQTRMQSIPGWNLRADGRAITRRYKFANFLEAQVFVNTAGAIAEEMGHHPDITFGWGYAEFLIQTHDAGGALTQKDFGLASKINAL